MRKLTILMMILGLLMCAGIAQAADSGAVAVTSTIVQGLDMTVNPNVWEAGSMAVGATKSTFSSGAQGYFTVTNNGNGTSYMDIKGSISGGCSLGAAAGANTYRIGHGQATGLGPYTEAATYAEITNSDANLATILAGANNTHKFDLELKSPTSTTYGGVEQTIIVTITAKTS